MKKILCILSMIFLSCFITVIAEASPVISLNCKETVNAEETFDVYIAISENSDVCSGRITVGYDNTVLEIVSATPDALLNGVFTQQNINYTPTSARISWSGVTNLTSGGNLFKLTFKAKTVYEDVNASIFIQEMKFTDSDGNIISCTPQNHTVKVKAKIVPAFFVECAEEILIGSNFEVMVNITENSLAAGGRFDLVYDNTKFKIVSVNAGDILSGTTAFVNPDRDINKIRLSWAGTTALINGGTVLEVEFEALQTTDMAEFTIENAKMTDYNDVFMECLATGKSTAVVTELICSTDTIYTEENGMWKFDCKIKNCPKQGVLIIALYSGEKIVGFKITDISDDVSKTVYLDKSGFDKAKAFIWESEENMIPVSEDEEIDYE